MEKFIPVCEPFLNGNELKYVTEAVQTGWISSSGKYVTEFEKQFAAYCGCEYGAAVCNGTIALHLALLALGIGKDDEVIIPTFTMIASAFAVCYTGAKPVFVDADKDTWNIDVTKIEEKITPKTKAIPKGKGTKRRSTSGHPRRSQRKGRPRRRSGWWTNSTPSPTNSANRWTPRRASPWSRSGSSTRSSAGFRTAARRSASSAH